MSSLGIQASLFERVGGVNGVSGMVDRFYSRVLADQGLKPYFDGIEIDKLRRMQFEFFAAALDGPIRYGGRSMAHVHRGRRINREHFQAFVGHLFETLKDLDLSEDDRCAIIARVNTYADEVIGTGVGPDT